MLGASSRTKRRWVACLAAGLLLFTQMAMAGQACMLVKAQPPSLPQQSMAGCESMPMDQAVCQAQCASVEQAGPSLDQHFTFVASTAVTSKVYFPIHGSDASWRQAAALPAAGPPLRVLYCSYLI